MEIQRKRILWRIPLVVTILVAIFWGIWYLVTGEVPATQIKWDEDMVIQLPFAISRLWDIIFAPIWAFLLIFLLTNKKSDSTENDLLFPTLLLSLLFGLLLSLVPGLLFGLVPGLFFGLVFSLGFSLFFGLVFSLFFVIKFLLSISSVKNVVSWLAGGAGAEEK